MSRAVPKLASIGRASYLAMRPETARYFTALAAEADPAAAAAAAADGSPEAAARLVGLGIEVAARRMARNSPDPGPSQDPSGHTAGPSCAAPADLGQVGVTGGTDR